MKSLPASILLALPSGGSPRLATDGRCPDCGTPRSRSYTVAYQDDEGRWKGRSNCCGAPRQLDMGST